MPWKLSPINKKCVEDVTYWVKILDDGNEIMVRQSNGYRWGWAVVEERPKDYDPEDGPLNVSDLSIIDHTFEDGCWSESTVENDEDIPEEEEDLLAESGSWLDDIGYEIRGDNEVFFYGPLDIEEVEK